MYVDIDIDIMTIGLVTAVVKTDSSHSTGANKTNFHSDCSVLVTVRF